MTDIKSDFGKKLKALRKQKDISQEELAFQTGLHRTYISDVERGTRNVSLENIEKIAQALNISIGKLFE